MSLDHLLVNGVIVTFVDVLIFRNWAEEILATVLGDLWSGSSDSVFARWLYPIYAPQVISAGVDSQSLPGTCSRIRVPS